jgi:sulfite exporter TauE/SafE
MEEQPSFEPSGPEAEIGRRRQITSFGTQVGRVLLISFVGAALYALVIGPRDLVGFSDGLFIAGAVLLLVGLMPLAAEIFGRATISFRLEDGDLKDVLNQERRHSRQGETTTYLFGISGIIVVALSFLISFSLS